MDDFQTTTTKKGG